MYYFSTSELKFGLKAGLSTELCTGIVKIDKFNTQRMVHVCLPTLSMEASNAFDN